MSALATAPRVLLGMAFLGSGGEKLAGTDAMTDLYARFRYPQWFRVATGAVEVAGAAAMLAGGKRPVLAPVSGALLGATMAGAIASHLRAGDPGKVAMRPAVLLALVAGVTVAGWRGRDEEDR